MNNNIELLSPVGTKESMIAGLNAGCNAIYLGGKDFNARQSASNFTNDELREIIEYCHLRGVKVNLTLNILYKESEIQNVLDFVSEIYSYGVDAIIIQDIGIFSLLKNNFPKVKLHASTQMTTHNLEGVMFMEKIGFDRVVISRELSLEEIENITKTSSIEIEAFIHGALCVSYSGRCLMSSLIGDRSGNRGRCAQPCRMQYQLIKDNKIYAKDYLISPKDTSTLPIIDKLVHSGIHTFKIEGRMKSPEYVFSVTSTYRKYIDKVVEDDFLCVSTEDNRELTQIFNRGGSFITGYYETWSSKNMISPSPKSSGTKIGVVKSYNKKTSKCEIELHEDIFNGDGIEIWTKSLPHTGTNISKPAKANEIVNLSIYGNINKGDLVFRSFDKKLDVKLKQGYNKSTRKLVVNASIFCRVDNPLTIELWYNEISVKVYGEVVQQAINSSLSKERILENASKTGNTPFSLNFVKTIIDEDVYLSIKDINTLRRNATDLLENKFRDFYTREKIKVEYSPKKLQNHTHQHLTALVKNIEQFNACINSNCIKRIYIELSSTTLNDLKYFVDTAHNNNNELYFALPNILRKSSSLEFYEMFNILEKSEIDGYLVRNYITLNTDKNIVSDYTFNVYNNQSIEFLQNYFDFVTLSPELNISEISALASENTEIIAYGKLPLMTTHQCPVGLYVGNKSSNKFCKMKNNSDNFYLKDRKDISFPIENDCFNCFTTILNNVPIFVLNKSKQMKNLKTKFLRLNFTDESFEDVKNIVINYNSVLINKELLNTNIFKELKYTTGHFFKGVQ